MERKGIDMKEMLGPDVCVCVCSELRTKRNNLNSSASPLRERDEEGRERKRNEALQSINIMAKCSRLVMQEQEEGYDTRRWCVCARLTQLQI